MSAKWYALQVKPHKERSVFQLLEHQDVELFFPIVKVKPKNPRSAKQKPYFPGYLFICADLEQAGSNAFSWIQGTHGLVTFGDTPAVVPDELIDTLKMRLEQINAMQTDRLDVKSGEKIRITSGPFAGYEAIFDRHLPGSERVQILLAFLSSYPQSVQLDEADIEKME
jgi:transcription elongation factor/antiterminator RfaH